MPIFDTHAHYDSGAFNADRDEILSALPAAGVALVVNPGCDLPSLGLRILSSGPDTITVAGPWRPSARRYSGESCPEKRGDTGNSRWIRR